MPVKACPECDSGDTYHRKKTADYRCRDCAAEFDDPVERPDLRDVDNRGSETVQELIEAVDDDRSVCACPECDAAPVCYRPHADNYYCRSCGAVSDDHIERAPRYNGQENNIGGLSAAGRAALAADPDDVRADGGGR